MAWRSFGPRLGGKAGRVLGGSFVPKSLNYNNQAGLRASWGEGRPVAASCLGRPAGTKLPKLKIADIKNVSVCFTIHTGGRARGTRAASAWRSRAW